MSATLPITRTFIVGCPRSGTTLLQSLLTAHPAVVSFPETFYFVNIVPNARERWRRHVGLASASAPSAVRDLDSLGVPSDPAPAILPSVTVGGYARRFVRRMDRAAQQSGATLWLEKTPRHARHIERIEQEVAGVRFVHLIRSGEAVAASLKDASNIDPEVWPSSTPLQLVEVWRRYLGYSQACVGRSNHVFVSYERLVTSTETVMSTLCRSLGLDDEPSLIAGLLLDYRASSAKVTGRLTKDAGTLTLSTEPWKQDVSGEIDNRNEAKFRRLFTAEEQAEIRAAVTRERDAVAAIPFV